MKKIYSTSIILAGGSGKRMGLSVPKQLLDVNGKPLLYYTIKAFEDSYVDDIILVVPEGEKEKYKSLFIDDFGFKKIKKIVFGGAERYDSVYNALKETSSDIVLVHDGARAFITPDIIDNNICLMEDFEAVVTAMPVKDTIKIADTEDFVMSTPNRETLWQIETPQTFKTSLLKKCYESLYEEFSLGAFPDNVKITDDSMVVERYSDVRVKLIKGSYENIKVTTIDDIKIAEEILSDRKE